MTQETYLVSPAPPTCLKHGLALRPSDPSVKPVTCNSLAELFPSAQARICGSCPGMAIGLRPGCSFDNALRGATHLLESFLEKNAIDLELVGCSIPVFNIFQRKHLS